MLLRKSQANMRMKPPCGKENIQRMIIEMTTSLRWISILLCCCCIMASRGDRREMLAAIRSRKANIMRDREAALARLNDHPENDFKRRFRMHRYQFDILVTILLC
jgi:hypothetical protein